MKKRLLAFALVVSMLFNTASMPVAAEGMAPSVTDATVEEVVEGTMEDESVVETIQTSEEKTTQGVEETEEVSTEAESTEEAVEETSEETTETMDSTGETTTEETIEEETIEEETTEEEITEEETMEEPVETTEVETTEENTEIEADTGESVSGNEQVMEAENAGTMAEEFTTIELSHTSLILNAANYYGSIQMLSVLNTPKNSDLEFIWTSSNESVATVSGEGMVTAVAEGTAVITVSLANDARISATCKVTVKNYEMYFLGVGSYRWWGSPMMFIGEKTTIGFGEYNNWQEVKVTLGGEGILSYENGELEAIASGEVDVIFEKDGVKGLATVLVTPKPATYFVSRISSKDSACPAILQKDGSYVLSSSTTYSMGIGVEPYTLWREYTFGWTSSDETVATVDQKGNITPLKAGVTTITVSPKAYKNSYIYDKLEIKIVVKDLPSKVPPSSKHVWINEYKKLGDVPLTEGWQWKSPNTQFVVNGDDKYNYFTAVAVDESVYPLEQEIRICPGKITGIVFSDNSDNSGTVLYADGTEKIYLEAKAKGEGCLYLSPFVLPEVRFPEVEGVKIESAGGNGKVYISATKPGNYTIKPVVKIGDKVFASTTFKFKAVDKKQVEQMEFTTDTEGVTITDNKIIFASPQEAKNFSLNVKTTAYDGEVLNTPVSWKTTDKGIATVKAVAGDTHTANVTIKGDGQVQLLVTAKDVRSCQKTFVVEIQNHEPRISKNNATVNLAYNYDLGSGRQYAAEKGEIEIVPVYGESISTVTLFDTKGENQVTDLFVESRTVTSENGYLVVPSDELTQTGKRDCILRVTTKEGGSYDYPFKITIENKRPSVSVKVKGKANLFYRSGDSGAYILVSTKGTVSGVAWEDASSQETTGFLLERIWTTDEYDYGFSCSDIRLTKDNKLVDKDVAKGTVTVKLSGYREPYVFENIKIPTTYKKPVWVSEKATNAIPDVGVNKGWIYIYDKTEKEKITYNSGYNITYDDTDLELEWGYNCLSYAYTGEKTKKVDITISYDAWNEPITFTHTINVLKPKAELEKNEITLYTKGVHYAENAIKLSKSAYEIEWISHVWVKGANKKSQELLDKNLLEITHDENGLIIQQNNAVRMNEKIKPGTYSYKITPYYYVNEDPQKSVKLNTLTLKVKMTDKKPTAKVTPKGAIDISKGTRYDYSKNENVVRVTPKYSNLPYGATRRGGQLIGEYSELFKIEGSGKDFYIRVKDEESLNKLRANQSYKLAIEFRFDNFTVTSNTFSIKPKQTVFKFTLENNNPTIYLSQTNLNRYIEVPSSNPYYYYIASADGGLDLDQDGSDDIVVSGSRRMKVSIVNKSAVKATSKGVTYNIPVLVKLEYRDGISKDAKVTVKITVKQ